MNHESDPAPPVPICSTRLLVIQAVLVTLIVVGTIWRIIHPFVYNPMDSLWSDPGRHYANAFMVKGGGLASILNAPGFEIFLQTVLRITGDNRILIAAVMAVMSAVTPWVWYRWLRELTADKTIALFGYAFITFLPSYFRIFSFFMDSVLLLPLTGAGLWLTWRAARKGTWRACLLAAVVCGCACATKSVALPVVVLPWLYVGYRLALRLPRSVALSRAAVGIFLVLCIYGLGPLKVWAHTGAVVLMPDGIYNQRYFESGARDIQVQNTYNNVLEGGTYVEVCVWGSSSVCYPPFYPLPVIGDWTSTRFGRYYMDLDYTHGRDLAVPVQMDLWNRVRMTFENIIYFFFEYQWPEDNDWHDFPRNVATMVRWIWFPLTLFVVAVTLRHRRREFMTWYFIVVTLAFMFEQSAVMEGRYKKVWEGMAVGAFLYVVCRSRRYQVWRDSDQSAFAPVGKASGESAL